MKELIKKLNKMAGKACVTLLVKTHRSHPDNEKDPIALKNLMKEAEQRLEEEYSDVAEKRIEALKKISNQIDHSQNKEGLVIVVNDEIAEYHQLPVEINDRVVIDNTFATRDIVRASHERSSYYVLVLSRNQARMIAANNNHVDRELKAGFPMENDIVPDDKHEMTMSQGSDKIVEHFFNKVDKSVQKIVNENPAPVILATEERNYDHYKKVMDRPVVVGHINKNHDKESAEDIVRESWPVMREYLQKKNQERLSELQKAVNQQLYLSDLSDIWRAVNEGRGETIFVERGYFQPAQIEGESVTPVDSPNGNNVVDDIVDEMIEVNQKHGGDTVFLNHDDLKDFQGLALKTRF